MKTDPDHRPIGLLLVFYLLTRLPLITFNDAEFTDAYLMFSWSFVHGDKWHPLYPLLIQLFSAMLDPILAGRFLSILFGCFSLFFLWRLANKFWGSSGAFWACILAIVSPLLWWVQIRVLTESLFIFTCLASVNYFFDVLEGRSKWSFALLVFFSGLCALTRPEGLLSSGLLIVAIVRLLRRKNGRTFLFAAPGLASWLLLAIWYWVRTGENSYRNEAVVSFQQISIQKMLTYLVAYVETYPYVLCYPVFILAVFHFMARTWKFRKKWAGFLIVIHTLWLGMLAYHWAWSTRLLIFPATLLLIEAGAMIAFFKQSMRRSSWMLMVGCVVLFSFLFAGVSIYFQKETYADFRNAALFIRSKRKNQRVFSDEMIKVRYYLQSAVFPYSRDAALQPGDIINLHSFHTPLKEELFQLSRRYKIAFVYSSGARTIPILGNTLAATMQETNQVSMLQKRFYPQPSASIVLQVLGVK